MALTRLEEARRMDADAREEKRLAQLHRRRAIEQRRALEAFCRRYGIALEMTKSEEDTVNDNGQEAAPR